jgi:hypothetical protein
MSDTPTPQASPVPESGGGFVQNLIDVWFSPREAFARILQKPRILAALALYAVVVFGFTGTWMAKMNPTEFMKTQIEESGRADQIPAERREAVIEQQARMMPIFGWVVAPVFIALMLLVISGTLLFVFRFFYGGEVDFKQAFAITLWTFLGVGVISTPVTLTVLALKGDWNIDPNTAVMANLGLLLDKSTAAKPLWALFTSIDLFVLWMVFLLAVGFAVACRKKTSSALWGVVIPWLVVVAVKVGWSALF